MEAAGGSSHEVQTVQSGCLVMLMLVLMKCSMMRMQPWPTPYGSLVMMQPKVGIQLKPKVAI